MLPSFVSLSKSPPYDSDRKTMNARLILTSVVVVALTISSGVIQGRAIQRWSVPDPGTFLDLTRIPTSFGDWKLVQEQSVSDGVLKTLKAESSVFRIYKNDAEQFISMAVIAGPCGPVSVHIPEICYSSQEYTQVADRVRMKVDTATGDEYWSLAFLTKNVDAAPMTVCYAWSDGGNWEAPDFARKYFAGKRRLFKVQLAAPSAATDGTSGACADFLKDFVEHAWPPPSQE
jgi:hypothetical protein